MDCYYCRHLNGAHHRDCPEHPECADKQAAVIQWRAGRVHGRRHGSRPGPLSTNYFRLGYLEGERALEEAQNGAAW